MQFVLWFWIIWIKSTYIGLYKTPNKALSCLVLSLQSWQKGFGTPPHFQLVLYGIYSYPAIHTHKHGLNKIFPPTLPLNKVDVHKVYKICKLKGVWLVTPNTVQGGGESTWSTFSSPKTQSVPNVLTRIVASEQALRLGISLKVDVRETRERKTRTRGKGGGRALAALPLARAFSRGSPK